MNNNEASSPSEQIDIWVVVPHADYSGIGAYEDMETAMRVACNLANKMRNQVGVYQCQFYAVAVPKDAEIVRHG